MDVGHDSSDAVVILNQAAPTGFFEHVQDLFPVAESIEESGQGSQVHTEGGPEQKMGSDTGQFVHNRPDIFGPFRDFQPHRLFDTHTQGVTVHMGRKVIQPVGQCQSLGIGEGFTHFFDSPVDISTVDIHFFYDFSFQGYPETEHSMCGRVLGADVYDVFVIFENNVFPFFDRPFFCQFQGRGCIRAAFTFRPHRNLYATDNRSSRSAGITGACRDG